MDDSRRKAGRARLAAAASLAVLTSATVGALVVNFSEAVASSGQSAAAHDRTATIAYLRAELTYEKAVVAAAPRSAASVEALAQKLDGECPGVVAGAKERMQIVRRGPRSPRQRAEEARERRQWDDLASELRRAIDLASDRPYQRAMLAFARTTRGLHWSDTAVTRFERAGAASEESEATGATPRVCSDMKAWAQSGYTTLTASTLALSRERGAAYRVFRMLFERAPNAIFANPLGPYEGSTAHELERRTGSVDVRGERALAPIVKAGQGIDLALGVTSEKEIDAYRQSRDKGSAALESLAPKHPGTTIGKGRDAAGNRYAIWVSRNGLGEARPGQGNCERLVHTVEADRVGPAALLESSGEPTTACFSRTHPIPPRTECATENRTIEAQVPANTSRVRLTLANGDSILSRAAYVPRRLGGPAAFYYQAVHVWTSPPVLLTALDRQGRSLIAIPLRRSGPSCPTQWPFAIPGSLRTIATGKLPSGSRYAIVGRSESPRYEPTAHELSLSVEVGEEVALEGNERRTSDEFTWYAKVVCKPQPYSILYGILKDPRDTVSVRDDGRLESMRQARIAASLHAEGTLAYVAVSGFPSELIVRGPSANATVTQKLASFDRESAETCEGEAEPPPAAAPAPSR